MELEDRGGGASCLRCRSLGWSRLRTHDKRDGCHGASRTELWSPALLQYTDTTKYKKAPPCIVGFSNASVDNTWRLAQLHSIEAAAARHKDVISN